MKQSTWRFTSTDNIRLEARRWQPTDGKVKGVVCLVHGMGEHSGRYAHVATYFTNRGYVLAGFDLRGHGKSPGQRGHIPSYGQLMLDIDQFVSAVARTFPDIPLFLYGHSMGGNLVLNYLLRHTPNISGAVVTAPALKVQTNLLKVLCGQLMNILCPGFSMPSGINSRSLSREKQVSDDYDRDPLNHSLLSARLGMSLIRSGQWAIGNAHKLRSPVLLMHGTEDRVCFPQGSEEFATRAGKLCQLKLWPGLLHELHNEPEYLQVLQYVVAWLQEIARNPVARRC